MYINKYIKLILIIVIIFNGCNNPEPASNSTGYIRYGRYLDGNIRSFDIMNDTLFVASEDEGIMIYQINQQSNNRIILDSLSFINEYVPVALDIAKDSRSLIVLDDYDHTYIGKVDFFYTSNFLTSVTCDDYQRKSAFIDYLDEPIELITPFRHKSTQNEVDTSAWNTSFLHRIIFDQQVYDLDVYSGDCSDTLIQYLNYDIEDVYYNDEKLYLVNPDDDIYSLVILAHDLIEDSFNSIDTLIFDSKPLTVKTNQDYIFIGLDDNEGCYIKLLGSNDINNINFSIASGYDIQDIQLSDDYIALSAGYGGSLIYENTPDPQLSFLIKNVYAYKTIMYDDFNMIVGTKNGLHIYEIER